MTSRSWQRVRLKHAAPARVERLDAKPTETAYVALENIESWSGRLLLDTPIEDVEGGVARFESGDVLFGKLRPYLAKVARPDFDGVCSTELVVLRPQRVLPEFLQYYLLMPRFIAEVNSWTVGTKMPRVSPERLLDAEIHVPSIEEQRPIVRFLNERTAKLDELIDQKHRLGDLLQELQSSVLEALVLLGPREPSAVVAGQVQWRGEFPHHWTRTRMKNLVREVDVRNPDLDGPLYALSKRKGLIPREELAQRSAEAASLANYKKVLPGQIVMNKMQAWNGMFAFAASSGIVSPEYTVLETEQSVDARYVALLCRTLLYQSQFLGIARGMGTGFLRVHTNDFGGVFVALPPTDEQVEIVRELDHQSRMTVRLRDKTLEAIKNLQRYRSALITAAVTGQIDVGSAA